MFKKTTTKEKSGIWDLTKTLIFALLIAGALRSFLFEPFNIPSGSMIPNLLVGDFLFVSKWPYGFSKYSFPMAPNIFSGRIMDFKKPDRGDVIVFKFPKDTAFQYIKRLVGLPGDKVQMREGILYVNGEAALLERIEDYNYTDDDGTQRKVPQYAETFPNGHKHAILKDAPFGEGDLDNSPEYTVPAGHYFVMGDNRDHSGDSRVMYSLGFVAEEYLLGPADLLYFSTEKPWWPDNWKLTSFFSSDVIWWKPWVWPSVIRYDRILKAIK